MAGVAEAEHPPAPASPGAAAGPAAPGLTIAVASTYTAEPIADALRFWLDELGLGGGRVEFAPYNQVLQGLLDPGSLLGRNRDGVNLLLVRVEDWARFRPGGWDERAIRSGASELIEALGSFAGRSSTPTIVALPPPSAAVLGDAARSGLVAEVGREIGDAVGALDSVHFLGPDSAPCHEIPGYHDEAGDRLGHMPYGPEFTAAMATAVARRVHAIKSPPFKVVALDCDNTLWRGVVGEDGPGGIGLGPGMKALQEFVVARQAEGMVVCLVSKNAESDVLEAFDARPDFPLRREHLVSWRIGWGAKSSALVELAEELNLGLDSFIFLDDNPVECAEVRAALPQVLTLQVPPDEGMADFLRHAWAFDRLSVTKEDASRTLLYRQNADRARMETRAADIGSFLASLELRVAIGAPSDDQWARVAQLTQRTNQFNFTTVRRGEAEARRLGHSGLECLRVEVSDRFGDYGLVGVLIFGAEGDALAVDTMLLSCRVLGRGVEHAMFAHLGRLAIDRGLAAIEATLIPTPKNEPAANFLRDVAAEVPRPGDDEGATARYRIAAAEAASLAYRPGEDASKQLEFARTGGGKPRAKAGGVPARDRSASYARIAGELARPGGVLRAVEAATTSRRSLSTEARGPSTAMERELVDIWRRALRVDRVGVLDDFVALGGTSLKAASLFAEIERRLGVRLPMTTILDAPTVERLAARLSAEGRPGERGPLRLLKPGREGGPALFLVHDGDGETLLYLNLARRLPDEVAVYGLEPRGTDRLATVHTGLREMAADYAARVREARPGGPYLLGGMCAGGTIAFEMAVQLRDSGAAVGLVALLDAADSRAGKRLFLKSRRRWENFARSLRGGEPGPSGSAGPVATAAGPGEGAPTARGGGPAGRGAKALGKLSNLVAYEVGEVRRGRARLAAVRALRDAVARGGEPPEGFVGPSFRAVYEHAEGRHSPRGRLRAPVLLVRAGGDGDAYPTDEPHVRTFRAPDLGWGRRVEGAIEIVDVPGGHGGMLQEPHVAAIAGPLRDAIARALAGEIP